MPLLHKPQPGTRRNRLIILALWLVFYASFTLVSPPLLDDADSVHAEVAREMLLRHDWVTLYANGIRYLEKAPLLYWSMAASMRVFGVSAPAARLPLALTVLALALALESFARRAFDSARAGLYAALITLSSFGIFIFTRITIPDALVCLWITLALYAYWRNTELPRPDRLHCYAFAACCALNVLTKGLIGIVFPIAIVFLHLLLLDGPRNLLANLRRLYPATSIAVFLDIALPWHFFAARANPTEGHPAPITFVPAPATGHALGRISGLLHGHWLVPLPTDGNVHGWTWFYFINEHLLRYLNLRVPRDYDTVPLLLFYALLFVWLMPWSAFLPHALATIPLRKLWHHHRSPTPQPVISTEAKRSGETPVFDPAPTSISTAVIPAAVEEPAFAPTSPLNPTLTQSLPCHPEQREEPASLPTTPGAPGPDPRTWVSKVATAPSSPHLAQFPVPSNSASPKSLTPLESTRLLLGIWAAVVMLFFSFSTRQEYYVLPALPALILLIAGWLNEEADEASTFSLGRNRLRSGQRIALTLFVLGSVASLTAAFFVLNSRAPNPNADLSILLKQNPGDYTLSFGHFLDLNARAMGAFRAPLILTSIALFTSTLLSWRLRRDFRPHAANISLTLGAFLFLLAAHGGLSIFSTVLTSQQLAAAMEPQLKPPGSRFPDLIVINGEYEAASTLGFYLHRPTTYTPAPMSPNHPEQSLLQNCHPHPEPGAPGPDSRTWVRNSTPTSTLCPEEPIHILNGRSSNLWYGSFFPDAPRIFEDDLSIQLLWTEDRRVFLWTEPEHVPKLPGHTYLIAESGGKEILSNQPNPF